MSNALVYPGTWPATTPILGTLDLTYVKPIADASHYWSAKQLTVGNISNWVDRNSGAVLSSPNAGQAPLVYSSLRKVVRFNGTTQRLAVPLDLSGPRTFAIVGGFAKAAPEQMMTYGYDAGTAFNIYQGSNGNFAFNAGKTLATTKAGDAQRHVFLAVSNGANSVFNIDGTEWAGDAGSTPAKGFRIGANATAYFGLDIEAIVILPFAATATRRASLVADLKAQYKL